MCGPWEIGNIASSLSYIKKYFASRICLVSSGAHSKHKSLRSPDDSQISLKRFFIHWGIRHLTLSIKKILDELKEVMIELNLNKDSVLICLRFRRMANAQLKAKRQTKAFCATPESNAKLIFT